jgi:hypothetical protein
MYGIAQSDLISDVGRFCETKARSDQWIIGWRRGASKPTGDQINSNSPTVADLDEVHQKTMR